ncbi:MAG: cytochrome c, partial [Cyanobacteria bacterium]|nr:cytochrome c [Cyanobacteriota bacterium]
MKSLTAFVSIAFVASAFVVASARQATAPAVFTAAQAAAGQTTYAANCASCHLVDLAGQNEAPQLAGPNFRSTWGKRTTSDLIQYMSATMPPGRPSLADQDYVNLAAFILRSNGAGAGTQALSATTAAVIGSVATGRAAAAAPAQAPARP